MSPWRMDNGDEIPGYAPMVISDGRFSVNLVVPALTETACRPLAGDTAVAAPPLIEMVPALTQLGILT